MNSPIRTLIVDDSVFICHTLAGHLKNIPEIEVVGIAHNGIDGLAQARSLKPDVIVLDVEMPRMDGLTTLQHIMTECPTRVIMFSVLTKRGARTTVQALMRGAVDFVSKPDAKFDIYNVIDQLIVKIKTTAQTKVTAALPTAEPAPPSAKAGLQLRQKEDLLIVIGASTGGPRALQQILCSLPATFPAAIAIVQHMPANFTRSLAQRLHELCPLRVQEAATGDRLARGLVLLAPGDFHVQFKESGQIVLDQGPRRHFVRPSVDVTMESAAQLFGSSVIGVVLTGMGSDGTDGARAIKAAGGRVVVEHESTSIVYGMPQSVVAAGLADYIKPLPTIASTLVELVGK